MLSAFTAGLLLITISELGDKTFFIAMLMAMRYRRRFVFVGVVAALAAMTLLSVLLGRSLSFIPQVYIHHVAIALFIGCGLKLIWDAYQMGDRVCCEAAEDAEDSLKEVCIQATTRSIILQSFTLTFIAEWGDRTQFSTIVLASAHNPVGVAAGAILGHAICAVIAILGGSLIAGHMSERLLTLIGGVLFIGCGMFMAWQGSVGSN